MEACKVSRSLPLSRARSNKNSRSNKPSPASTPEDPYELKAGSSCQHRTLRLRSPNVPINTSRNPGHGAERRAETPPYLRHVHASKIDQSRRVTQHRVQRSTIYIVLLWRRYFDVLTPTRMHRLPDAELAGRCWSTSFFVL